MHLVYAAVFLLINTLAAAAASRILNNAATVTYSYMHFGWRAHLSIPHYNACVILLSAYHGHG